MGASIAYEDRSVRCGEPVGTVTVSGALSSPVTLGHESVASLIDELPLLGCLAAYAPGVTQVTGAAELRVKESDRIAALVSNLTAVGVRAEELADGFVVHGERRALSGAVRTFADHRIAMAFGVLSSLPGNNIVIDDRECVAVSYPGFWDDLRRVSSQ
jgi:3-phosphoshikimate 1-carboxyvinyltransferase